MAYYTIEIVKEFQDSQSLLQDTKLNYMEWKLEKQNLALQLTLPTKEIKKKERASTFCCFGMMYM